ncbi:MAG: cation diffusion facilitator family transporter [Candidatus Aenigmatarchaeota archaeon]
MERDLLQKKFRLFIFLSAFILILEVVGGIFSNSLALLSDAGHVLVDLLALLFAYFAMRISRKQATKKFTYGYYRTEIFAAIINGIVLLFITLYIFYESYQRLLAPQAIKGWEMLVISVIGLLGNLYVVMKMRGHEKENLNVRGAYLHVLTDLLSSVGVVATGFIIIFTGNYIFDPIISVIIGLIILISSLNLIRESVNILMEAAPGHIDIEQLSKDMLSVKGVKEIHDLHVWSISSDVYSLTSHVLIDAKSVKMMNNIVKELNVMLESKYKIMHSALQSECDNCVDGKKKRH